MSSPSPPPGDLSPTIKIDGEVPLKIDAVDGNPEGTQPPALPPRPPPRPRVPGPQDPREVTGSSEEPMQGRQHTIPHRVLRRSCWLRKYVFLCTACGGLSVLLGSLFLTVYFMLRSYTTSLHYFETVPTYVPASMLIVTGCMVMCLAGRRNRYSYLIKLCGGCCLCCAVLCVVVTVTTTVFHMNRLQSLRECVFTQKTQTCTCYSVLLDSQTSERGEEGTRYIFNSTPDCEVIHGALYSCLRAMFGLSVIGILVCIFSCMLVYQLLSHEKKKMYWEQLELRCRYLSRQQRSQHCACCDECRFPPPTHEMFPWELDDRYWTPRVGNLYSPNPGGPEAATSRRSGWSWRRLPWSRSTTSPAVIPTEPTIGCVTNRNLRHSTASPDSQYGFSSRPQPSPTLNPGVMSPTPPSNPPTACQSSQPFTTESSQSFYMWGPPPPYTSPCRRQPLLNLLRQRSPQRVVHSCHQGRQCCPAKPADGGGSPVEAAKGREERVVCSDERCEGSFSREDPRIKPRQGKYPSREHPASMSSSSGEVKNCENYVNTSEGELVFDESCSGDNTSGTNTLPIRKSKKFAGCPQRAGCHVSSEMEGYEGLQECGPVQEPCCQRCQYQRERRDFEGPHRAQAVEPKPPHTEGDTPVHSMAGPQNVQMSPRIKYLARLEGIANQAFETQECGQGSAKNEQTESEVYFADVSSCCNVSVKNDGHDSSIYDEALDPQNQSFKMHPHGPHPAPRRYPHGEPVPMQVSHKHPPSSPGKEPSHRPTYDEDFAVHKHSPVRVEVPLRNVHPHVHRPLQEAPTAGHRHHYGEDHRHLREAPHRITYLEDVHGHPEPRAFRGHPHPEDNDSEDEALLQSHCFSYQRFSRSQGQGFLLRGEQERLRILDDLSLRGPGREERDMEGSSNSATPLSENTDSTFVSPMTPHFEAEGAAPFYGMDMDMDADNPPLCAHGQNSSGSTFDQSGSPNTFHQHQMRDNHEFLAPDAQYETIPQKSRAQKREEEGGSESTTPQRRRLNVNVSTATSPSVREILSNFERGETGVSTDEEVQQNQSDATMDSGCHSDEFTSRRHVTRASLRGKESACSSPGRKEQQELNTSRSVNV